MEKISGSELDKVKTELCINFVIGEKSFIIIISSRDA